MNNLPLSDMGDKLPNGAGKLPIDDIYGALEKEEGPPTRSEIYFVIFLAPVPIVMWGS